MFFGLENKRNNEIEDYKAFAEKKHKKLQMDNLKMMEERDRAISDVGLFQGALEQKNKEKELVEAQLAERDTQLKLKDSLLADKDKALADAIKRAKEAESALKKSNDDLPSIQEEWRMKGIESCAEEVVQTLNNVYQQGYDFALDKMNVAPDHELRVPVSRPIAFSDDDEGEEDEQDMPIAEDVEAQVVGPSLEPVAPTPLPHNEEGAETTNNPEEADHAAANPTTEA